MTTAAWALSGALGARVLLLTALRVTHCVNVRWHARHVGPVPPGALALQHAGCDHIGGYLRSGKGFPTGEPVYPAMAGYALPDGQRCRGHRVRGAAWARFRHSPSARFRAPRSRIHV
ncbi:hypothetical protein EV122DRAFT_285551 [Schizophyllum commune]